MGEKSQISFGIKVQEELFEGLKLAYQAVNPLYGPTPRFSSLPAGFRLESFSILEKISLFNPRLQSAVNLLKEFLSNTHKECGDGVTLTIVAAYFLLEESIKALHSEIDSQVLCKSLDDAFAKLQKELKRLSFPITSTRQLGQIAKTTIPEKPYIAHHIEQAFAQIEMAGSVKLAKSKTGKTYLEIAKSLTIPTKMLSPYFATDPDLMSSTLDNPLVLLIDGHVTSAHQLLSPLKEIRKLRRPLLLICLGAEERALASLVGNKLQNTLSICATEISKDVENIPKILDDIARFSGANILSLQAGQSLETVQKEDLGSIFKVTISPTCMTMIEDADTSPTFSCHVEKTGVNAHYQTVCFIHICPAENVPFQEELSLYKKALTSCEKALQQSALPSIAFSLFHAAKTLAGSADSTPSSWGEAILAKFCKEQLSLLLKNYGAAPSQFIPKLRKKPSPYGINLQTANAENLLQAGVLDPFSVSIDSLSKALQLTKMLLKTHTFISEK